MKKIISTALFFLLAYGFANAQYTLLKVRVKSKYSFIDNYRMRVSVGYVGSYRFAGNAGSDNSMSYEIQGNFYEMNKYDVPITLFAFRSRCEADGKGSNGDYWGYEPQCYCGGLKLGTRCSGKDDDNDQTANSVLTREYIKNSTAGEWHDFEYPVTSGGYSVTLQYYYIPSPTQIKLEGDALKGNTNNICGDEPYTLNTDLNFNGKFVWKVNTNDSTKSTTVPAPRCVNTNGGPDYPGVGCPGSPYLYLPNLTKTIVDTIWEILPQTTSKITLIAPRDTYYDYFVAGSMTKKYKVYTVDGKDTLGKVYSQKLFIYPPKPTAVSVSITNVKCRGEYTGKIQINSVAGGYDTLFYSLLKTDTKYGYLNLNYPDSVKMLSYDPKYPFIFPDQAINTPSGLTGLPAGTYKLVVENYAKGLKLCGWSQTITITEPDSLQTQIRKNDISCNGLSDGVINIKALGGTPPYQFSIDNGTTYPTPSVALGVVQLFPNLASKTYLTKVKDSNGCLGETVNNLLIQPEPLNTTLTSTDIKCFGEATGVINFVETKGGNGGYIYSINGDANYTTNVAYPSLKAGNYVCYVADSKRCKYSINRTLLQPKAKTTLIIKTTGPPSCAEIADGKLSVGGIGGTPLYSYQLDKLLPKRDSSFVGIAGGKHTVQIIDNNACKEAIDVNIPQPDAIKINLTTTNVACYGQENGTVKATVLGGAKPYKLFWDGIASKDTTIKDLASDTYTLKVVDKSNCTQSATAVVSAPTSPLSIANISTKDATCESICDGAIAIISQGGTPPYQYSWGSNTSTGAVKEKLCANRYPIRIVDSRKCSIDTAIVIETNYQLNPNLQDSLVLCPAQMYKTNIAINNYQYLWTLPNGDTAQSQNIAFTKPGKYSVSVSNAVGCRYIQWFEVLNSAKALKAKFLLPSQVALGDTVVLSEVSMPEPDSVRWNFGYKNVTLCNEETQVPKLFFDKEGTYTIKLSAFLGECKDSIQKNISFYVPHIKYEDTLSLGFNKILNVKLYPNPNDGKFTVGLKMEEPTTINFQVLNALGQLKYEKVRYEATDLEETFSLDLIGSGIYALKIITPHEVKILNFVME